MKKFAALLMAMALLLAALTACSPKGSDSLYASGEIATGDASSGNAMYFATGGNAG